MRTIVLFIGFILIAQIINAQSVSTQLGARGAGMGYTSATVGDAWSLFNNPGGISKSKHMQAAFAYELHSQLKNANRLGAAFYLPWLSTTSALGLFRFGDDLYNEQIISGAIGNEFGNTSLGIKLNYIQYQAVGFGTSRSATLDLGGITNLTENFSIGAYITNLTQSKIGTDKERLPTRLTVGVGFTPIESILILTEISKELTYETTWRTGIEYSFKKKVYFRTGFNLKPDAAFFGLGIHKKKIQADYAVQFNQLIGATHQASIIYQLSKVPVK